MTRPLTRQTGSGLPLPMQGSSYAKGLCPGLVRRFCSRSEQGLCQAGCGGTLRAADWAGVTSQGVFAEWAQERS